MGLFENTCSPSKTTLLYVTWSFLFPSPSVPDKGPKEKPSTTHPKRPLIKFPHYQCDTPGIEPMVRPPSTIQVYRTPVQGFPPRTSKRPRHSEKGENGVKIKELDTMDWECGGVKCDFGKMQCCDITSCYRVILHQSLNSFFWNFTTR